MTRLVNLVSEWAWELNADVPQSGILVEIAWPGTPLRWSSFDNRTFQGNEFVRTPFEVEDLVLDGLRVGGTLIVNNADLAFGSSVLANGLRGRSIKIWTYLPRLSGDRFVTLLTDLAVAGGVEIGPDVVRITLRSRVEFLRSPRSYVGPQAGFNTMLPAGTVLRINGQNIRLDRRG
jgi:hypothetical protein